jgi:hypothetical protein
MPGTLIPKHAFGRLVIVRQVVLGYITLAGQCLPAPAPVLCPPVPTLRALVATSQYHPMCSSLMSSPPLGAPSTFACPVNVFARAKSSLFRLVPSPFFFFEYPRVDEWLS